MGFLRDLTGDGSEVNITEVQKAFSNMLTPAEQIENAFKMTDDLFIFTNKRLILIDTQGVTVKTIGYHSIPYNSITHFSIETTGHFDLEAELIIWVSGNSNPICKEFDESQNVYELQSILAQYVLK